VERQLNDWIKTYLQLTKDHEACAMYHKWVAISLIAATLDRNVHVHRGNFNTYPNQYIILAGKSGLDRKSSAIKFGFRLYREALPALYVGPPKITAQALEDILSERFEEDQKGSAYFNAEELKVFLGDIKNLELVAALTVLNDPEQEFHGQTRGGGRIDVPMSYLNILGGTTPQWLKLATNQCAGEGGFFGRIQFIIPTRELELRNNPFPDLTEESPELRAKLIHDLRAINKITGIYPLSSTPAGEYYGPWYTKNRINSFTKTDDVIGFYSRVGELAIKLATCIAASKRQELTITVSDMKEAIELCEELEKTLPHFMQILQGTIAGETNEKVLRIIKAAGTIEHSALLRKMSGQMQASKLWDVLATLQEAELIIPDEELKNNKSTRMKRIWHYNKESWSNE